MDLSEAIEIARLELDSFHAAIDDLVETNPVAVISVAKLGFMSLVSWRRVMMISPTNKEILEAEHSQMYVASRLKELERRIGGHETESA